MRFVLIFAGLLLASASAEARVKSYNLTCEQARAYVQENGAVILQTGTNTYDRYVAHGGYCDSHEVAERAWVPTRDNPRCLVGYTCEYDTND